ncbi:MAG TPA: T9SS type A sorting domain-containing protein [Hymenobacter sp.]|jgi:uncharacterized delta-60 repeat protein
MPLLYQPVVGQALDPSFNPVTSLYASGEIYSVGTQQADGKRVIAGFFTRINGTPVSRLVRVDAAGALDQPFMQNVGTANNIYRVKSLPSGQYLLGASGGDVRAGGISRTELLRLNADGTADSSFDPGTGPASDNVYASSADYVAQPDGKVVVAGYFDSFNNVPAPGLVRLNANGSVDATFSAGTGGTGGTAEYNHYPRALAIQPDGKILVGGSFTTFSGHATNGVVRLNANGSVDPTFRSPLRPDAEVDGLVLQPNGNVLVNGPQVLSTNNRTLSLARLLPSGSLDPNFATTALNGSVLTAGYEPAMVLQPDGKILVVSGTPDNVTRLNSDGTPDPSFRAAIPQRPVAIGLQPNGSLIVGFNVFSGVEKPLLGLTNTGAPDPTFVAKVQSPGTVGALIRQPDGKLLLGGNFTELNGQPVHRLVRLTANGTPDADFTAATGVVRGVITCLLRQPDGKVVAGTAQGMSRFETNGTPDPSFSPPWDAHGASSLAIQPDGKLVVSQLYSGSVNGVPYNRLLRLTNTGAFDPTFVRANSGTASGIPGVTDAVLVQPDGRILVGGIFQLTGQSAVGRVVRYESTGAIDPTFNTLAFTAANGTSSSANHVFSLAFQPDGKLLVGGNFGAVNGQPYYGVARLTTNGSLDATFTPSAVLTGPVYSFAQQPNGRILLGGSFTNAATVGTSNLSRILANGPTDAAFTNSAAPNGSVRAILVQPDGAIVLAGNFTTVGGQPNAGIARIIAPNALHVAAPAAVAARTTAWPVPAHGQLHITTDASAHPLSLELLDGLGRRVRYQPVSTAAEQTLDVANLPAGMYLLRVSYEAGIVTRRLAVQ